MLSAFVALSRRQGEQEASACRLHTATQQLLLYEEKEALDTPRHKKLTLGKGEVGNLAVETRGGLNEADGSTATARTDLIRFAF